MTDYTRYTAEVDQQPMPGRRATLQEATDEEIARELARRERNATEHRARVDRIYLETQLRPPPQPSGYGARVERVIPPEGPDGTRQVPEPERDRAPLQPSGYGSPLPDGVPSRGYTQARGALTLDPERTPTQWHLEIGPIGSRGDSLRWNFDHDIVHTGCFTGTSYTFMEAVAKTHQSELGGVNLYYRQYKAAVDFGREMQRIYLEAANLTHRHFGTDDGPIGHQVQAGTSEAPE